MEYPKDLLDRISRNKAKGSNEIIKERSKGTVAGSVIGGAIGLIFAFSTKRSYLVFGTIGVFAGGFISHFFISKELNKKNKTA